MGEPERLGGRGTESINNAQELMESSPEDYQLMEHRRYQEKFRKAQNIVKRAVSYIHALLPDYTIITQTNYNSEPIVLHVEIYLEKAESRTKPVEK